METLSCVENNPFIIIRSLRILNMVLLGASAAAILLLNENGYTFDTYKDESDIITISLAVAFILLMIALLLLVLHWTRLTLKAAVNLWFSMLVSCGIVAFMFFIFDISYATMCDKNEACVLVHAMEASAALKFLSMLVWFGDAIHLKHVNNKYY